MYAVYMILYMYICTYMYIMSRCQYHDNIIDVHVFDAVSYLYVILSRKTLCEKVCGRDCTCSTVSSCARRVRMKLRPQPNHNEVSATPTTSALNAHKVVDKLYILHILCNDVMYSYRPHWLL